MEIGAKVYAVAKDPELLREVYRILTGKAFRERVFMETLESCAVLPLRERWYGFVLREEPADRPEGWLPRLRECAGTLLKNGAVVVEFRSPDHPDDYLEYAYTTSRGDAGAGKRPGMAGYDRATGNRDIRLAIDEMFSGRSAQERQTASRRKERKEALRREKGDFEITADGVLKKYRGHDTVVVIPDGVREIGESAFVDMRGVERMIMECEDYDAPEMETLVIPDSVVRIRPYAFAYCQNLVSVEIPDSVTAIGDRSFEGCESLKEIRLPAGLTEIEEYTFFLCWSLKKVVLPERLRHIRKWAFQDCPISRITLPEGLESIGEKAFDGCGLREIRIPESVTEIADDAFPKGTEIVRQ